MKGVQIVCGYQGDVSYENVWNVHSDGAPVVVWLLIFFPKLVCIHAHVAITRSIIRAVQSVGLIVLRKSFIMFYCSLQGGKQPPRDNSCKMGPVSLCTHWWDSTWVRISDWLSAAFATNQSVLLYPSQLGMLSYLNPEKMDLIYWLLHWKSPDWKVHRCICLKWQPSKYSLQKSIWFTEYFHLTQRLDYLG